VTLRFLGEVTDEEVGLLGPALRDGVAAQRGPLQCRLGPATAWFSRVRVLQLPARGLDELAAVVARATAPIVPQRDGEGMRFNGHVTLARIKGRLGPQAQDELQGIPFDSTFAVEHVDLVASEPSPQGHVYTTLLRAPLGRG
jgi:2'-5' RNA ligase